MIISLFMNPAPLRREHGGRFGAGAQEQAGADAGKLPESEDRKQKCHHDCHDRQNPVRHGRTADGRVDP
jgi:hypothetical protein